MPHSCDVLLQATHHLLKKFNCLAGRYITLDYPILFKFVEQLEDLYIQKTKELGKVPEGTRLDQIGCIRQLLKYFRTEDSEQKLAQAHSILYGACLYRYKRLFEEYNCLTYRMWGGANKNCALFMCLEEGLQINRDNPLDNYTLYTSCTAYFDYLKQSNLIEEFKYFKKNPDFVNNCNDIIKSAFTGSGFVRKCIEYVFFIQSIAHAWEKLYTEEVKLIEICSTHLILNLSEGRMTEDMLEEWLKQSKASTQEKNLLQHLFSTIEEEEQATLTGLREKLTNNAKELGKYVLLGAYYLTLFECNTQFVNVKEQPAAKYKSKAKTNSMPLKDAILDVLHTVFNGSLDVKNQELALTALNKFLECWATEEHINFLPWKGKELAQKRLTQHLTRLRKDLEQPGVTIYSMIDLHSNTI